MPLFLLFLLVPLIEIGLFIQIGGWLGLWPTLAIVVLTAIAGTWLVRSQGVAVLSQLKSALEDFGDPTEPLAHGAMILFSGALLLTPGFFTDVVGFLLLVPGVRHGVMNQVRKRIRVTEFERSRARETMRPREDVIDGEFHEVETEDNASRGPSGWTRH